MSATCEYLPAFSSVLLADCDGSLEIFALFMLTGIFSTLLLPETKGKSLEELSNEDQEHFVHGDSDDDASATK